MGRTVSKTMRITREMTRRSDGDLLRSVRKSLNLTQKEVADAIGVDHTVISRLESGERDLHGVIEVSLIEFYKRKGATTVGASLYEKRLATAEKVRQRLVAEQVKAEVSIDLVADHIVESAERILVSPVSVRWNPFLRARRAVVREKV